MLRRFYDWVTLADYEQAKERATDEIIARYARGNVALQNGWYMDEAKLEKLSRDADRALARARQLVSA